MSVYFDNAATTPISAEVREAILPFLNGSFGNPSAIHSMGRQVRAALERARKTVAQHLNASPSEIFFTSCGTEANNTVLVCSVRDLGVKNIITSPIEHHCILHCVEMLEQTHGTQVHYLNVDSKGRIDYDQLAELLPSLEGKTLVSLMHANNEIGTMIDLDKVADICKENEALFHSDTVQTFGHFAFDLQKTKVDFMVSSAHKFHGPKGIGFLYARGDQPENQLKPLLYGGSQERNMRAGTENVIGIIGMGKAVEEAYKDLEEEQRHILSLKKYLKEHLEATIAGIEFNGDPDGHSLYTVLSASFPPSEKNAMLLFNLDISGFCVSGGSACSSGASIGSHVLQAIGAAPDRTPIRFSFSKYNTKEEVDQLIEVLKGLVSEPESV